MGEDTQRSQPYKTKVDHLGFPLRDEESSKHYENSQAVYLKTLARRSSRWERFMKFNEYKYNKVKLRRFIRKGIPNEHRSKMWMLLSGAQKLMADNTGLYSKLKHKSAPLEFSEAIDIDLPRTFPGNIYYKDESSPDSLKPLLRRVLNCFAIYNPAIGYCQGLNYVAGLMLLVLRDEERTFWLLNALTTKIVPDYYVKEPVAMVGLQADLKVLSRLVKNKVPEVETLMTTHKVDWSFVCTKWFVCLYVDILPVETVLRIWDCLFMEGRKALFRVALLLIMKGEVTLISSTALHHVMEAFQRIAKDIYTWYSDNFMKMVYEVTGDIPSKHLDLITLQCRKIVLDESTAVAR